MGYTSHQAGTCGLHIHVNRDAFGNTEGLQDVRIARILYFFEKNWEELLKFSRRTQGQLNQWAARYGYKDQPREILDHAKKGGEGGRYSCVNLQNRDTIGCTVMSVDPDCQPEIVAMIGASIAISISDVPWNSQIQHPDCHPAAR